MSLKSDVLKFFSNYPHLANPFVSLFANKQDLLKAPNDALRLAKNDDLNFALWNTLGTMTWLAPLVGFSAYFANRNKHKKLRELIDTGTSEHINSDLPILSPNSNLSYTGQKARKDKELKNINILAEQLNGIDKKAAGEEDKGYVSDLITRSMSRAIPILSAPLAAIWIAKSVQDNLKEKYKKELESEISKVQRVQDAVDMNTLQQLGYITRVEERKEKKPSVKSIENKNLAALSESVKKSDGIKKSAAGDKNSSVTEDFQHGVETLFSHLPLAALLLFTGGTAVYGTDWLLKHHNDTKKLKFLEEKALGRNRSLIGPELIIELPEGYKEALTKKKQSQIIPGIDAAPTIEDAQIIENSKKDAFLG